MLTDAQLKAREGRLTASRIAVLMTGDAEGIRQLWLEMVGEPVEQQDLSGVWAVQLGAVTESLNLDWYERKYGPVSRRGEVVSMGEWFACTLDGWDDTRDCPIECKHVGGFEHLDRIIDRYQPQMQFAMTICSAHECALSVIVGAQEPVLEIIPADADYQAIVWKRATHFMKCVEELRDPVPDLPPVAPPVVPVRTYDMTGNNSWANHAAIWLEHHDGSRLFEKSKDDLKKMVPKDAVICKGHGIEIKRDRAGGLRIRKG